MSEIALIGKKVGMTREFYKSGQLVPVTVLKIEKARVIQVIDTEKRGYKAVQLGYGKIKNSKLTKAMKGYFTKKNTEPKKKLKEFKVSNTVLHCCSEAMHGCNNEFSASSKPCDCILAVIIQDKIVAAFVASPQCTDCTDSAQSKRGFQTVVHCKCQQAWT